MAENVIYDRKRVGVLVGLLLSARKSTTILYLIFPDASRFFDTTQKGPF